MVAFIRTCKGRVINPRAGLAETKAALKAGVKIAAVVGFGAGRLLQGRVASVEGGRIHLDGVTEAVDPCDVCSIVLTEGVADNDRENPTS